MSTAAMIRAVQDLALSEDANTAVVAVYRGLVATLDHLLGGAADLDGFPDDAVLQAGRRELSAETVAHMVEWLLQNAEWIENSSDVLDQLDEVAADPFPVVPPGAEAYRSAAEQLVHDAGHSCAAVSWAGVEAAFEFTRLYTDQGPDLHALIARDPVATAALRNLSDDELHGVRAWVRENWIEIDAMATEAAA
ncbi:hypothetical protein [Mycobacterium sp. D16Q16]|uniref:hypothetical protein n=1 Tax=Mycobacterium sp. D16Q16 TaxID=1855659 RepID=UPI0011166E36|nr:hypothetical protein [Mycobacterium sp. D16Q16]